MNKSEQTNYFQQLRLEIADAFDIDELQEITFDLGLDWEELAGNTKSTKITSLLITIGQSNRLEEFIILLKKLRPQHQWATITNLQKQRVDFIFFQRENQVENKTPIANVADIVLSPQELRNRRNFLNNFKRIWIDGVLYNLLYNFVILSLNKNYSPDAIARSSRTTEEMLGEELHHPGTGKSIQSFFEESGRKLLILGEAGSGKTTTLLQLASELVNKAEKYLAEPLPVVLNLSTWNQSWANLQQWFVEEIFLQYQVAREISADWLVNGRFILLLDGLDEVPSNLQDGCVVAINDFLAVNNSEVVVCSRIEEYKQLNTKLNLGSAIELQSLTTEQVNRYLVENNPGLHVLREILPQDEQLQELAKSPLMLGIMTLAYQGIDPKELEPLDTIEKRRTHLFDHYIDRMFKRKKAEAPYTQDTALQWLANIARYMDKNSLANFQIETIQPTWLSSKNNLVIYWLFLSVLGGITVMLGVFTISLLSSTILLSQTYPLVTSIRFSSRFAWRDGLIFGTSIMIAIYVGHWFFYTVPYSLRSKIVLTAIIAALSGGLVGCGLAFLLYHTLLSSLTLGPINGLTAGLLAMMFVLRQEIKLVELLRIQFPDRRKLFHNLIQFGLLGLLLGLLVTLGALIARFSFNLNYRIADYFTTILFYGFIGLIVGFVTALWQPEEVTERNKPNEGIYTSFWNAVKVTFLAGLATYLFNYIVRIGLVSFGIFLLTYILYFLIISSYFFYGGVTIVQHFALRLTLAKKGLLPYPLNDKKLIQYLDNMVDYAFLRRAGSSWMYIHRTLMKYFSQLRL